MNCLQCCDKGYTYDERCLSEKCDHRIKEVVSRDKKGNVLETAPLMECPKRPCSCRAGKPYKEAIRKRLDNQAHRIDMIDRWNQLRKEEEESGIWTGVKTGR